jgi:peptide/nickel transport system substrate-binding protein
MRPVLLGTFIFLLVSMAAAAPSEAAPEGQVTYGVHISLAPTWFDPAETPGIVTPFMVLYGLHDAMLKALPGNLLAPALAESWTASPDGLTYEFVLRRGVKFHNGDPVTAEDVKFSFERYRGSASKTLKERVAAVETPDPGRVRFRLKQQPWPDFLLFYSTATGAGWIVPKKYVEKVGDDGFKKAPIGAGPYRFVSFTPGVELVMEAVDGYWRKTPSVKRLVLRVIPDPATRYAALKSGEIDVTYWMTASLGEDLRRTPGLTLKPVVSNVMQWVAFVDQWDPKSPWHDRRMRLAVNLAIDRPSINQAETLGHSLLTNSIIPNTFDFFWAPPPPQYDPARAKKLLAEAGYPNGLDAGDYTVDAATPIGEPVVNSLQAVGIRAKLRPLERAAFQKGYSEKKYRNLVHSGSAAFGNAATRIEAFIAAGGAYVYGSYPDIDGLFREQATDLDKKRRETTLRRIQQLIHEKAMVAPIVQVGLMSGYGPRVEESGLGLITGYSFSAPYEDVRLKGK